MKRYGIYLSVSGSTIINKWCDAHAATGLPKYPYNSLDAAAFACKLYESRNPEGTYSVREIPNVKKP